MGKFLWSVVKSSAPMVLALAMVAIPNWTALATPGELHIVKSNSANLRAGPSKKSKIVGRLVRGDRVMEFERRGHWLKVQQMGTVGPEGWVSETLLAPEPRPRPPLPEEPQANYEDQAPEYAAPERVYYIVRHKFHRRFLRRHKRLKKAFRHGRPHKSKFGHRGRRNRNDNQDSRLHRYRHDGQPHGAPHGERRLSGPYLRSRPAGG